MTWRSAALLATAILLAPTALPARPAARPAAAVPAPGAATMVEPITVTAKPLPPETKDAEIQDFVRAHAVVNRSGRMARWREPICPITFGAAPQADEAFITAQIVAVARAVGTPVDPSPKCRSNRLRWNRLR